MVVRRSLRVRPKRRTQIKKKVMKYSKSIVKVLTPHHHRRSFFGAQIVGQSIFTPYLGSTYWQINQLPNYTEFSALYDQYMITYVKMYVHLKVDPSSQTGTSSTWPKLYWVPDHDDSATPGTLDELRQRSKCRWQVLNPNRPIVIKCKPSLLIQDYRTSVTTGYTPAFNKWVDFSQVDVPHYGIKFGIDDLSNTNYKVDFEYRMWFKCKDTR